MRDEGLNFKFLELLSYLIEKKYLFFASSCLIVSNLVSLLKLATSSLNSSHNNTLSTFSASASNI